jgi:hypothetical protein
MGIRDRLDQRNPAVREGMRLTFELLRRMDALAAERGTRFVVAVIPTKETVFAEYFNRHPQVHLGEVVQSVIRNEGLAKQELLSFLDEAGIPRIDVLPALRKEVRRRLYTRSDGDMHPGGEGYRVIGQAVAAFLQVDRAFDAGTGRPR